MRMEIFARPECCFFLWDICLSFNSGGVVECFASSLFCPSTYFKTQNSIRKKGRLEINLKNVSSLCASDLPFSVDVAILLMVMA